MRPVIAPSLLSADAGMWGQEIGLIDDEGVKCLHLDIMDGRFVPNLTFGPSTIKMLRKYSDMEYDAHLMVFEPESMIPACADAGVDSATVHYEACIHLSRVIQVIKQHGMKAGVAINPATPAQLLSPILPFLDRVLVMTVNPGFGGQQAILPALEKVAWLKDAKSGGGLTFEIQSDGGVNRENIRAFIDAGVENIVIGSALYQAGKTRENIRAFNAIIAGH